MKNNSEQFADWESCPAGVIQSVARVNKFSRRRMIFKLGALTAVLGAGVFAKQAIWPKPDIPNNSSSIETMCCNKVRQYLNGYSTNELCDKTLMLGIKCHLRSCKSCREEYQHLLDCCDD